MLASRTFASVLTLLLLTAGCRGGNPVPKPTWSVLEGRTEVPLLEGSHPRVRVEVAGIGSAVLLVDTGAEFTLLAERFVRSHALPLEPLSATAAPGSASGRRIEHVTHVARLEIGAASVSDLRPGVLDFAGLTWLDDTDGILGQDLLCTWLVVLDGPGRRLVLLPQSSVEDAFAELFDGRVGAVRFEADWRLGIPLLPGHIAGAGAVELVLDTGANFLCLPSETIEALKLPVIRTELVDTLDGSAERSIHELPKTALGALTIWGEVHAWERGVLGWSLLSGLVTVQEGRRGRVYLLSAPPWK